MRKLLALPLTIPLAALRGAVQGAFTALADAVSGDSQHEAPAVTYAPPSPQRARRRPASEPGIPRVPVIRRPTPRSEESRPAGVQRNGPADPAQQVAERLDLREGHVDEPDDELVESEGAADPGAEIHVAEPWPGYATLRAPEVLDRLVAADSATRAVVRLYESAHRNRRSVIEATQGGG